MGLASAWSGKTVATCALRSCFRPNHAPHVAQPTAPTASAPWLRAVATGATTGSTVSTSSVPGRSERGAAGSATPRSVTMGCWLVVPLLVPTATSDPSITSSTRDDGDAGDGDAGDAQGRIDTRCFPAGGRKVAGSNPVAPIIGRSCSEVHLRFGLESPDSRRWEELPRGQRSDR